MYILKRLFYAQQEEVDESKLIFYHLPQYLKRVLTLSEIKMVLDLLKQYHLLRQKNIQNITSVVTAHQYIAKELSKQRRSMPQDAVNAIVNAHNRHYVTG